MSIEALSSSLLPVQSINAAMSQMRVVLPAHVGVLWRILTLSLCIVVETRSLGYWGL